MRKLIFINLLLSTIIVNAEEIITQSIEIRDSTESPFGESSLIFDSIEVKEPISYDSGELLDYFLGVNRIQNGGFSSLPLIQGLSDDRIKIKIDGMDLIASCANHMNAPLSYATPFNVDAMSVVAGLSSVSQGGDNIGGVIKINSFLPSFTNNDSWLIRNLAQGFYKSNNETFGLNYSIAAKNKNTSIRYYGSGVEANNYHAGSSFKKAGDAAADRNYLSGKEVGSTEFQNTNHQLNYSKKIKNNIYDAQFGYHYSPYESFANQRMDSVENESFQGKLSIDSMYQWGNTKSVFYLNDTKHKHNFGQDKQYYYASGMMTSYGMPMQSDGKTLGLNSDLEIFINDEDTIKTGFELQFYRLDDTFHPAPTDSSSMMGPNSFLNINNGKRDRFDFFAQLDRIWNEKWLSSLGLRYGMVKMDSDDVHGYSTTTNMMTNQVTDSTAFNNSNRSKTDHNIDASLLTKYTPNDLMNIEFGYTLKTRSPNIYQRYTWSTWTMAANMNNLYGDGNGYVGNIDLDPESAHKLGFLYNFNSDNKRLSFKLNPYYSYIKDYIDVKSQSTRADGFRTLKFFNQDAYIYGIDILGAADLGNYERIGSFKFLSKLNYQRGKNKDNNTNLYNLMPLNLNLSLNHSYGQWTNSFITKIVDSKNKVDSERLERETAGYAIIDYKSSYQLRFFQLVFGINNILDKKFDDPLGGEYLGQGATMKTAISKSSGTQVPGMGRTINLSIIYDF